MTTENAKEYGYKLCSEVKKNECPYSKNCGYCKNCVDTSSNGWSDGEYFCSVIKEK